MILPILREQGGDTGPSAYRLPIPDKGRAVSLVDQDQDSYMWASGSTCGAKDIFCLIYSVNLKLIISRFFNKAQENEGSKPGFECVLVWRGRSMQLERECIRQIISVEMKNVLSVQGRKPTSMHHKCTILSLIKKTSQPTYITFLIMFTSVRKIEKLTLGWFKCFVQGHHSSLTSEWLCTIK